MGEGARAGGETPSRRYLAEGAVSAVRADPLIWRDTASSGCERREVSAAFSLGTTTPSSKHNQV